ncbi:MAG: type II toxin-antitoxin system HicA family toxin [Chloroflexota bacterium]|nr:type II toxin-antitoxin system HicA family toxin [Chloroflexota bacterium]
MSKRQKRLGRIRQNPKNVMIEDLQQVLEDHGFVLDRVTGSHYIFQCEKEKRLWTLVIPLNKPVKVTYVKAATAAIDEILALSPAEDVSDGDSEDERS